MIVPISELRATSATSCGAKAANLGELYHAGLPVPPGVVLPIETTTRLLDQTDIETALQSVLIALSEWLTDNVEPLAHLVVRTSALDEDRPDDSRAGQYRTEYFVTEKMLGDSIMRCLEAAAGSPCAIIVQTLVPAEVSGVVFTAGPEERNRDQLLVEAIWGLGRGLTEGGVDPDRFTLSRAGKLLDRQLGDKATRLDGRDPSGQVVWVDEERRASFTLDDKRLLTLSELARRCEDILGAPQDVEWVLGEAGLAIVQSRPISSAQQTAYSAPSGEWLIFKPLIENFDAPLTPLTEDLYAAVLPAIARPIDGRIYLDFAALKRIAPFEATDSELAELLLGHDQPRHWRISWRGIARGMTRWLRFGPWVAQFWLRSRRCTPARLRRFDDHAARLRRRFRGEPLTLLRKLLRGSGLLPQPEKTPFLLNASSARYFVCLWLVHRLTERWQRRELSPDTLTQLCTGGDDTLTRRMIDDLRQLGASAAAAPDVATALQHSQNPVDLHRDIEAATSEDDAAASARQRLRFMSQYAAFLQTFGHRAEREFELAVPRWVEDATPLLRQIRLHSQLEEEPADGYHLELLARDDLHQALSQRWQRRIVDWLLGRVRYYVGLRENTRHYCARALQLVRAELLEIGDTLAHAGKLDTPESLFFLQWAELEQLRRGELEAAEAAELIERNRREHERRARQGVPWMIGIPEPEAGDAPPHDIIVGRCAAPGDFEGEAFVVGPEQSLDAMQPGTVLVLPFADPALAPAVAVAGAVLCETGSYLSHLGTIAREYGVPCIVGARHARERLINGDRVRVRASLGHASIAPALRSSEST